MAAETLIIVVAKGEGIDLLAREAKNLVNEYKHIHVFTWLKWTKLICDNQIEFRIEQTPKKDKKTEINPTQLCYFTDGSSEKGQTGQTVRYNYPQRKRQTRR